MKQGKGIVVEVTARDQVTVMTPQGEFLRVPFHKPVYVGQEITYTIKKPPFYLKWSVAAVLLVALVGSAGQLREIPGGAVPEVYVTLDINPSIELGLNSGQRVVYVDGLNQDGKALLGKLDLIGSTFKQAVAAIETQAEIDGYLKPGINEIVVTISQKGIEKCERLKDAPSSSSKTEQEIETVIRETLADTYRVQLWRVPGETRQQIRETGMTPAKYIAAYVAPPTTAAASAPAAAANTTTAAASGGFSSVVPVTATVERSGDHHYFEFEVTRPVFRSGKVIRTSAGQE